MRVKWSRYNEDGICFMNWFMKFDEKVYIYGLMFFYCNVLFKGICVKIRIGLINIDFE